MTPLRQLADPGTYRPCAWNLKSDAAGLAYWIDLFRWHLDRVLVPLVVEEYAPSSSRLAALRTDYLEQFDRIAERPPSYNRLDVLFFTELRGELLSRHGSEDPFRGVKERANRQALDLWPGILRELDTSPPAAQRDLLARGLMAGNLFDLGSRATIAPTDDVNSQFRVARDRQPPRPWFADDVDAWWQRWDTVSPYRHVVWFVDNAGGDLVLGCLPWVRWMAARGARVTLAANAGPALNDITAAELEPLLAQCAARDLALTDAIGRGQLDIEATGSRTPLLDLTRLDDSFVARVADADLLILHGMGRAIESNSRATFTCDTLFTAVLKDEAVATYIGGKLFDCVFRFRRPGPS